MTPDEMEGRLLALRKALAKVLAGMPPDRAAELVSAVLLPTGEEDPAVLAQEIDRQTAAMGQELTAILAETERVRRGYG